MAITIADGGGTANTTSSAAWTFSPSRNFATGEWAVLALSLNNAPTNGVAFSTFTVTDSLGNTWTRRISPLQDPADAGNGVEGAIFTTPMDAGLLATGTVITVNTSQSTNRHAAALIAAIPTSGYELSYVAGGVNTGSSTNSPTLTTGTITNGDLVVAGTFLEDGSNPTADADTTNGTWSTQYSYAVGTSASGISVAMQAKTVTATATQTYNPTLDDVSDVILGYIVLTETVISGGGTRRRRILLMDEN